MYYALIFIVGFFGGFFFGFGVSDPYSTPGSHVAVAPVSVPAGASREKELLRELASAQANCRAPAPVHDHTMEKGVEYQEPFPDGRSPDSIEPYPGYSDPMMDGADIYPEEYMGDGAEQLSIQERAQIEGESPEASEP